MPTINIGPFEVNYDYTPAEASWFHPTIGVGNPGCDEQIEPTSIMYQGQDITDMLDDLEENMLVDTTCWKDAAESAIRDHLEAEKEHAQCELADRNEYL